MPTDSQIISIILLNIAGGDCVDDIERLEDDAESNTLLLKIETQGMKLKERREYQYRWCKKNSVLFLQLQQYLVI